MLRFHAISANNTSARIKMTKLVDVYSESHENEFLSILCLLVSAQNVKQDNTEIKLNQRSVLAALQYNLRARIHASSSCEVEVSCTMWQFLLTLRPLTSNSRNCKWRNYGMPFVASVATADEYKMRRLKSRPNSLRFRPVRVENAKNSAIHRLPSSMIRSTG